MRTLAVGATATPANRRMTISLNHTLFQNRTDLSALATGRSSLKSDSAMMRGYLLGLEVAAAMCRSHIVSAAKKFGTKSDGVRIGRADLCCIEREIRRVKRGIIG